MASIEEQRTRRRERESKAGSDGRKAKRRENERGGGEERVGDFGNSNLHHSGIRTCESRPSISH